MLLLLATNDMVLLSYAQSLLGDAGIDFCVFDEHISAIEGSIGIFPRRVMVDASDYADARRVLAEAGLRGDLAPLVDSP